LSGGEPRPAIELRSIRGSCVKGHSLSLGSPWSLRKFDIVAHRPKLCLGYRCG